MIEYSEVYIEQLANIAQLYTNVYCEVNYHIVL